jgi:hypothetical protein
MRRHRMPAVRSRRRIGVTNSSRCAVVEKYARAEAGGLCATFHSSSRSLSRRCSTGFVVSHHAHLSARRRGKLGLHRARPAESPRVHRAADARDGRRLFASNADGTLTVIHQDSPDHYHVVENVRTPQFSRNLGLDPTNHRLFVASAKFGPAPAGGRGRGPVLPDSFALLVIERDRATR